MLPISKLPKRQLYGFNDERYCFDSIKYNKMEDLYPYYIYLNFTIKVDIENNDELRIMKHVEKMVENIVNNYCLDYIIENKTSFCDSKMMIKLGIHKNELSIVLDKMDEIILLSTKHELILSNKRLEGFFK